MRMLAVVALVLFTASGVASANDGVPSIPWKDRTQGQKISAILSIPAVLLFVTLSLMVAIGGGG
jgi:hypothetical protein